VTKPLDEELLAAHARDDKTVLVLLYREAADLAEETGDIDAACFFLVHAYIFGLETAHPETPELHARLKARGRES
jgi:hypothetical protein